MSERGYGPAVGAGRRWLGRFHFTGVFWYRLQMLGVRIVPDPLMPPLVHLFTACFWLALGGTRRAVAANLRLALGPCSRLASARRSLRTMRMLAWCLTERYEQFLPRREIALEPEPDPAWEDRRSPAPGTVFVTAHFGGWEMGGMASLTGDPPDAVHVVRERELDPRADAWFERKLASLGGPRYRMHYARSNPALGVELLAALRDGGWVALQGDRPPTDGKAVRVDFLGRRVEFPTGPGLLARLSGAPLIPVFLVRTGRRRYRLHLRSPIAVPRTGDRDADVRAAMQAFARELEQMVRAHPHQWFCWRDLSRAAPAQS